MNPANLQPGRFYLWHSPRSGGSLALLFQARLGTTGFFSRNIFLSPTGAVIELSDVAVALDVESAVAPSYGATSLPETISAENREGQST